MTWRNIHDLPFIIQRERTPQDNQVFAFFLKNAETDKVVSMAYHKSPIPPKWLLDRQAKLNMHHFFKVQS